MEEMKIKLSDYVFNFLVEKGVRHVFMLPGGGAMHLDDSLGTSGMEYFPFLHEQGAAIAAEAYAQHTNTPGVVVVTSGPGATNTITAVAAGWIDSTPMIIISGQAKRSDLVGTKGVRQIGSQEVNIIPMIKPITKYAVQVLDPNKIALYLEEAWREATTGRPGPVWIDIPLDVQAAILDDDKLLMAHKVEYSFHNPGVNDAVKKTAELIAQSEKPLIIAGNGIKLSGSIEDFYQLVRYLDIPVQTTWKTIDFFDEEDPLYVGHPGIMGDRGANLILQEADLLISIGSRLDTSITAFNDAHFGMNAKKVIVDIDPNEIARMNMEKETFAACDAGTYIRTLLKLCKVMGIKNNNGKWLEHCKNLRSKYPVVTDAYINLDEGVSSYYFVNRLCEMLRDDDVIVPESSGGAGEITYQAWRLKYGQKMKNAAGLGSMGFGLPYAIGSCIANNRRRTILINGDGAFQLNIQELETLHRLKLPVKIFVWCNAGYASIRTMQRKNFEGRYVASEETSGLTMPNLLKIGRAYGFKTLEISNNQEVEEILQEILADDEPLLCAVNVNQLDCVSPRVQAYVKEDGSIVSGLLENMWPFLPEEEIKMNVLK